MIDKSVYNTTGVTIIAKWGKTEFGHHIHVSTVARLLCTERLAKPPIFQTLPRKQSQWGMHGRGMCEF